jgi:hypothetical protein
MSDVEIKGRISVDSGNALKSTNELIEAVKNAKKAVNDAKIGSAEYKKAQEELSKVTKELDTNISKSGGSFSKLKTTLGETVPGFKAASEGADTLSTRLKLLATNPIVLTLTAIVTILGFLYKSFASTVEGGKKVEQMFAGIQAVIQVLVDRLFTFGNGVIKFFTGDFKGAAADMKASVTGIGDEIEKTYGRTAELTKKLQDIRKEERQDALDKVEREKKLAVLREQLNDESIPVAKRIAAAKILREDQEKNAVDDLDRAKRKAKIQIELFEMDKDGARKHAEEINEINIGITQTETENLMEMVRTNKVIRNLENQSNQASKESLDAFNAKEKETKEKADKKRKDDLDAYIAKLVASNQEEELIKAGIAETEKTQNALAEKEKTEAYERERLRRGAELQYAKDAVAYEKKLQDELLAHKKAVQTETENILANGMAVFGKQTLLGKGLATAQALLNTYTGATEALRAKSALPSPFDVVAKIANVAAVLATGFKAVKSINSVQVPGGGGGGSVPSADVSAPAPLLPQRTSTTLDSDAIQGIGNAASGGTSRAFVLEKDIKDSAERTALINRAARLG